MKTRVPALFSFLAAFVAVLFLAFLSRPAFGQATVYNQPPGPLAQLLGGPGASAYAPTFAATIALDTVNNAVIQLNGVSTTSSTCSVTSGAPAVNKILFIICKASASGTVTYTFSTGFKPTGTAAPTAGTTLVIGFVGDGTNYFEFSRSVSAITG